MEIAAGGNAGCGVLAVLMMVGLSAYMMAFMGQKKR